MDTYTEYEPGFYKLGDGGAINGITEGTAPYIAMMDGVNATPATAEIVAYVAPTQAALDAIKLIADGKRYLAATDWYVTREAEKGTSIPGAITTARDQARTDANEV